MVEGFPRERRGVVTREPVRDGVALVRLKDKKNTSVARKRGWVTAMAELGR